MRLLLLEIEWAETIEDLPKQWLVKVTTLLDVNMKSFFIK